MNKSLHKHIRDSATLLKVADEMDCALCMHGAVNKTGAAATVTLVRGDMVIVVKAVPVDLCDNCGEEYVRPETAAELEALTDEAEQDGVEFMQRKYMSAEPPAQDAPSQSQSASEARA